MKDKKLILTAVIAIVVISILVAGIFLTTQFIIQSHLDKKYIQYTNQYEYE